MLEIVIMCLSLVFCIYRENPFKKEIFALYNIKFLLREVRLGIKLYGDTHDSAFKINV